jgi:predicted TPR repeat methyltransferase
MTGEEAEALARVYAARDASELEAAYADWAARYDADTAAQGYRLPELVTGFVARHVPKGEGPILDAGCGTGLTGDALHILGYTDLVGIDLSRPMLALAAARGIYARLERMVLGEPLAFADAAFASVVATGVFTLGHAPVSCLDELIRVTRPGGHVVFTLREELFEGGGFRERQEALEARGRWRLVEASRPCRAFTVAEPEVLVRFLVYRVG